MTKLRKDLTDEEKAFAGAIKTWSIMLIFFIILLIFSQYVNFAVLEVICIFGLGAFYGAIALTILIAAAFSKENKKNDK